MINQAERSSAGNPSSGWDNDFGIRLYSFITRINRAISRSRHDAELFDHACQIAVETGGFEFAWIGILTDTQRQVIFAASAGTTEADTAFFQDYSFDENGPMARALNGDGYFVVTDITNQPNKKFNCYAEARGFNSAICLVINKGNLPFAFFNLYSSERSFFNEAEVALLTEVTHDISFALDAYDAERQRRQVETALESKNIKLNQAQSLARLGTFEIDLKTMRITWSEELLRIYGIPDLKKDHSFEFWLSHIHPEDRQAVLEVTRTTSETLSDCSFSHRIVRNDGEIRNIKSRIQYAFDAEGAPISLIGIGQDVTEHHDVLQALSSSEDALRRSELRYRQIIELAQEGIWVMNKKGETVFTNEKISEILNYSAAEMQGKDIFEFIDNTNKKVAASSAKMWKNGLSKAFDICLRDKEGRKVWARMTSSIVRDEHHEVQGLITVVSDVTARKIAEEDNRFKANLLNMIGQAVIATDTAGTITYWNKAAEKLYGWKRTEAIGKTVIELIPTSQSREQAALIVEMLRQGDTWSGAFSARRKDGSNMWINATTAPVYDERKRLMGLVGISNDNSEEMRIRQILDRANRQAKYGTWEGDMLKSTLYWSDVVKEIHEVEPEFVPDIQRALQFYPPGYSRRAMTEALQAAIENGTPYDLDLEIITARGVRKWVRAIGEAEFSGGRCAKICGSFIDITDRKIKSLETEQTLSEKSELLKVVGEAFIVLGGNGRVIRWGGLEEFPAQTPISKGIAYSEWLSGGSNVIQNAIQESIASGEPLVAKADVLGIPIQVAIFPSGPSTIIFFRKLD